MEKLIRKIGLDPTPFTNTLIQTCVVACYSIAVGGGLSVVRNYPDSIKEPGISWLTAFLFLACFIGLFVLTPLRKKKKQPDPDSKLSFLEVLLKLISASLDAYTNPILM